MKYLKQLSIILLFSLIGEFLNKLIPLPIPTSIYGMILLFIALCLKIVKVEQVNETSDFLFSIMLIFFVPASVGIMDAFIQYISFILPILLIIIISTFVVMLVTSSTSQFITKSHFFSKKEQKKENQTFLIPEKVGEK